MTKVKGDIKVANTFVVRDVLLAELDAGVRTTCGLLTKIESSLADNWDYRLHPNMRTLLELVNHLVQIPHTDLAILQEKSEEEIRALEERLTTSSPEQLRDVMQSGYHALKEYMESLDEDSFLNKTTVPFYLDHGLTQAKWLTEIVTHVFHHRGQFFTYLKSLDLPVNMFDLY